jgi:murein DD-endopeptidase MepM/ murein hydrolase activator NlpD
MGGKAAVQIRLGINSRPGGLAEPRAAFARRRALPIAAGVSAFAIIAIAAATAPASSARSELPRVTTASHPVAYLGTIASQPLAAPAPLAADDGSEVRFSGRVSNDLSRSLEAADVPERQGREYVWLLGKAINLSDGLSIDDKFDLVIERGADGKSDQLVYAGLDRVARADVELLKWTDGKSIIWVNADGVGGSGDNAMRLPVSGRVTSGFGERFHPILGYRRMHAGLDLAAAYGSPIVAAADGRVVSAGWHGGYGRLVAIMHSGGIETMYGHMSRIVAEAGSAVRKGEVIGYVGSSGLSTGPHVHYEVLKDGHPVNPASVKMAGGPGQLEGEKLRQFHDALRALLVLKPS